MSYERTPYVTLPVAVQRGAEELRALNVRLERIEHQLEALFQQSEHRFAAQEITALQEIDMVVQSTDALSDYLHTLSDFADPETKIRMAEVVSRLPLRDLATRLQGLSNEPRVAGDPELF